MADTGTPPVIPKEFQQYNSYIEDPKWQIKFTIAWTVVLAFVVVLALPRHIVSLFSRRPRKGRWLNGVFGVMEDWRGWNGARGYDRLNEQEKDSSVSTGAVSEIKPSRPVSASSSQRKGRPARTRMAARVLSSLGAVFYWTPPGIGLNAGQILIVCAYAGLVLACILTSAPLLTNSNRAGFMALAQLPLVILLASKNTPLSLLFGPPTSTSSEPGRAYPYAGPSFAYTRLNPLHRWAGRFFILSAIIHGSLWINNHLLWDIPIIGEQKETSGVAALGVLGVIGLSSLRPVRKYAWNVFWWIHFIAFPAFFITLCYHTIYAAPWIIPPVAFYAFDVLMRMARYRIKDAWLTRVDGQMTIIHIPDCDSGFRGGQHLRLRVFFDGRGVFESHPLSVMSAPRGTTCLSPADLTRYFGAGDVDPENVGPGSTKLETVQLQREGAGILLGARVMGDWTRALNEYARTQGEQLALLPPLPLPASSPSSSAPQEAQADSDSQKPTGLQPIPVQVMFDGPYGGCELDLPAYERVLLVAGGSGATFALGVLDELVARSCLVGDGVTQRVDFVWCVRSFGSIRWFAPLLRAIAHAARAGRGVELRIAIYVTCLCAREEVPDVPGLEVRIGGRPDMRALVGGMMGKGGEKGKGGVDADMEMCGCGCAAPEDESSKSVSVSEEEEGDEKVVEEETERRSCCAETFEGRLAVCASGPESLTREASNAIARWAGVGRGVGLHTEVFAI